MVVHEHGVVLHPDRRAGGEVPEADLAARVPVATDRRQELPVDVQTILREEIVGYAGAPDRIEIRQPHQAHRRLIQVEDVAVQIGEPYEILTVLGKRMEVGEARLRGVQQLVGAHQCRGAFTHASYQPIPAGDRVRFRPVCAERGGAQPVHKQPKMSLIAMNNAIAATCLPCATSSCSSAVRNSAHTTATAADVATTPALRPPSQELKNSAGCISTKTYGRNGSQSGHCSDAATPAGARVCMRIFTAPVPKRPA
jgi:hypothetical protein